MTPDELANQCTDWTAEQLDQAIEQLGKLRASKQPPVTSEFNYRGPFYTIDPVRWNSQREAVEGKSLLHLRHPGFGWLHFAITPDDAKKLAKILLHQFAQSVRERKAKLNA